MSSLFYSSDAYLPFLADLSHIPQTSPFAAAGNKVRQLRQPLQTWLERHQENPLHQMSRVGVRVARLDALDVEERGVLCSKGR